MKRNLYTLLLPLGLLGAELAPADTFSLTPTADAFVVAAQPNNNYGGGGALSVASPALTSGEFQSVMRFDTAAAVAQFNTTYGAGNWTIDSVTLRLTATAPNNAIFNPSAAGTFAAHWMQNDSWVEGTGNPNNPTTNGITFASLPSFLGPSDEDLGVFPFAGGTSGAAAYSLTLGSSFVSDLSAGGLLSLRLDAADATVSYLFNSRSIGTVDARPTLLITAVPEPASLSMIVILFGAGLRRVRSA